MEQLYVSRGNVNIQKKQIMPDVTVGLACDQQGGPFMNAVGLTIGFPIPVLNNNKAKIMQAKQQVLLAQTNLDLAKKELVSDLKLNCSRWEEAKDNYLLLNPIETSKYKEIESGMIKNFKNGNVSLIEFTDFMESYLQTLLQYNKFSKDLINSCEQINYYTNSKIF